MVTLYGGKLEEAVAYVAQVLAGVGDGSLQPAVTRPVRGAGCEHFGHNGGGSLKHGSQLRLSPPRHLVANLSLIALVGGLVKKLALQGFRQVLLRYPMVAVGVGVEVALAVPEPFL